MDTYEIRVVTGDRVKSWAMFTTQATDRAAILRATALASEHHGVEVWRGMTCIYAKYREQAFRAAC